MFVITPVTCLTLIQNPGKTERLTGSQHVIIWALHNLTARYSPPSAVFSGRRMQVFHFLCAYAIFNGG